MACEKKNENLSHKAPVHWLEGTATALVNNSDSQEVCYCVRKITFFVNHGAQYRTVLNDLALSPARCFLLLALTYWLASFLSVYTDVKYFATQTKDP